MLDLLLLHYSSLSGFLPAIVALFRFRNAPAVYRPFIYFVWVAALGDALSLVFMYVFRSTTALSNCYVLAELFMLLWVFYTWNRSVKKWKYVLLGGAGLAVWILDNFILHSISRSINSIYRVYYCVTLMLLSIDLINQLIIFERKQIVRNTMFLACCTFAFYFSYKAYVESFYVLTFSFSTDFYDSIFYILRIINLLSNIMYAICLLCIPKKQEFSIPR